MSQDKIKTLPPPPPMTAGETYICDMFTMQLGFLRRDFNEAMGALHAKVDQGRTDTAVSVGRIVDQYQKLMPAVDRKIAKLKLAIEGITGEELNLGDNGVPHK